MYFCVLLKIIIIAEAIISVHIFETRFSKKQYYLIPVRNAFQGVEVSGLHSLTLTLTAVNSYTVCEASYFYFLSTTLCTQ